LRAVFNVCPVDWGSLEFKEVDAGDSHVFARSKTCNSYSYQGPTWNVTHK
jgi:hypothetical protein